MGVIDFSQYLNSAIEAGQAVEGNVVKVIADNGDEIGDAIFKVLEGGNGQAAEVGIATQSGVGGAIATGMAYLTMTIPTVFAAIAPCLGVVAGVGLYNLFPDTFNRISEALVEAGKTVGGKVITYWNGENAHIDEETIEIIKQALVDLGAFDLKNGEIPTDNPYNLPSCIFRGRDSFTIPTPPSGTNWFVVNDAYYVAGVNGFLVASNHPGVITDAMGGHYSESTYTYNGKTVYYYPFGTSYPGWDGVGGYNPDIPYPFPMDNEEILAWAMVYGDYLLPSDVPLQPDATYPSDNPFPLTYPEWYPFIYDPTLPEPSELPNIYPVKYPEVGPDGYPTQDDAQNPDPEPVPEIYPVILPGFPIPDPGIIPEPETEIDPDPQPEPDPIPEEEDPNPERDPVDPNPDPDPSLPILVPGLPNTVNSSRLFTVYNPTSSQLDALGGYLWDSSIIAAIRDIWQEPMDGLINLQQVFVTPSTSGSHNIILGFLDSGVSAAVVSNQFVTVDCGSVQVNEDKKNATDYTPYTSLHLYLPFIGIVELDTNECMNATISIKYKVDVYTGTCLAQVSVDRDIDMPDDPILYTFSGNCSQQLPLTSGNATGLLTALMGAVTAGFSAASGGGLSTLAGAQMLGNSLTHEMFHVSHSGNISANAGIMGQKKPYLIIGRRHGYDANDYNSYYGYPSNKTIVIGNHTGFLRIKKCWIKTNALQEEYNEIMKLLEDGVFV